MTPEQAKFTTNQGFEPRPICITPPRWNPTSHRPVPAPRPASRSCEVRSGGRGPRNYDRQGLG